LTFGEEPLLTEYLEKPAIDFGFKPRANARGDKLVALWRMARINAENAPACPCHGIIAGRVDPDTLEINTLTPLRTRYREAGQKDLRDTIERRLRKSPFAGMRQPLESWLLGLQNLPLTDDEKDLLFADLGEALQYHADSQNLFACA
jgi:hypothetical protein